MSSNLLEIKSKTLFISDNVSSLERLESSSELGENPRQGANLPSRSGKALNYDSVMEEKTTAAEKPPHSFITKKTPKLSPCER